MIDERDWMEFHDGLDALARGDLDEAVEERLADLSQRIPDGPVMLKLARALAADGIRELEQRVPDGLADEVLERVERALPPEKTAPRRVVFGGGPRPWFGLAAAAVVALVFLSGYLLGEHRQLNRRLDDALAAQGTPLEVPGAAGRILPAALRSGVWTAGELMFALEQLPAETVLVNRDDLLELLSTGPTLRRRPARDLLSEFDTSNGLTAGEALRLLAALAPDHDAELDLERLQVRSRPAVLAY